MRHVAPFVEEDFLYVSTRLDTFIRVVLKVQGFVLPTLMRHFYHKHYFRKYHHHYHHQQPEDFLCWTKAYLKILKKKLINTLYFFLIFISPNLRWISLTR